MLRKIAIAGMLLAGFVAGVSFVNSCGGSLAGAADTDVVAQLEEVNQNLLRTPAETITYVDRAVIAGTGQRQGPPVTGPTLDTTAYSRARVWVILPEGVNDAYATMDVQFKVGGIVTPWGVPPLTDPLPGDIVDNMVIWTVGASLVKEIPALGEELTLRFWGDTETSISVVVQLFK